MRSLILVYVLLGVSFNQVFAQTSLKDASNSLALYTKTKDVKNLDNAIKKIDEVYKTKKDSSSSKVNLIRAMIYADVAIINPAKKSSGKKIVLNEATFSLSKLIDPRFNDDHAPEINYINSQLAVAYLSIGNKASSFYNYSEALKNYKLADSLSKGKIDVINNLAVLSEKLGDTKQAINYYHRIIDKKNASANYYLALANLYELSKDDSKSLEVIEAGRKTHPENKDLLFKEINSYSSQENYSAVINLIKPALVLEKDNLDLYYLAGFSYEMNGSTAKAIENYEKVISLDPNNYDGNYALGLLYLSKYSKDYLGKKEVYQKALTHLLKANKIDPDNTKSLKSLLILYNAAGDISEAQNIQDKINQLN